MKQTSRGLAPSLNTGHSTFTGARQRLAVALVAIFIAFAGAQTAGAQTNVSDAFGFAEAFDDTNVSEINVTDNITGVGGLPSLNHDLTINLNGHTISSDELHFNVYHDGSLTINGGGGSVGNIIRGNADLPAIDNDGTVTLRNVNITTNADLAIGGTGMLYIGENVSFNGWTQAPFYTPYVNIEGGNYNYDPENYNPRANVVATVTVGGVTHYFENLSVALDYFANNPGNDGFSLWVKTAADWDAFCDMLEAGETFSGKTVVLAGDIGTAANPVTRMGSSTTQFQGTFDGQGHTLTVQYGTPSEPVNQQFVAPFPNVTGGATFRSLTIAGSIYSGYDTSDDKGTGGLIGHLFGGVTVEHCVSTVTVNAASDRAGGFVGLCEHAVTFTDCVSSAIVTCTGSGSGFVGWSRNGEHTIAFYGCLFSGKVLKQGNVGSGNGSFVGWKGFTKTVTITNCIAAPATDENMATDNSATFCRYSADTTLDNGETHITNCYYTATLGNAQGNARHTVTAGTDVTVAHAGVATHYATSGITAYKATGASADINPFIAGLLYNNNVVDVLYAGSDEVVSLTLSNTAPGDVPDGYQYGYTTNAGTLNGSTLTMPDENVTVSVNTDVLVAIDWATVSTGADKDNAYMIYNKDQLDLLAYRVNGTHGETRREDGYENKFFQLAKDISYPHKADGEEGADIESNYEAIGSYYDGNRSFSGHFDGNKKTISGIRIYKNGDDNADYYQGIFGRTASGADIHDLTLADARITGCNFTGGIVGYNGGAVTRCHVAADVAVCAVQSYAYRHGGIAGSNRGTIEQCTSAVKLTLNDAAYSWYYGGIAGENRGTLSDNLAIGATVPAAADNSYGAITGYNNDGSLQRNYYTACKVADTENATNVGCGYIDDGNGGYITADVNNDNNPNGAVSIHTLTLADGITTSTRVTVTIGTTGYYAQGTAIALSYSGTPGEGYQLGIVRNDGNGFTAAVAYGDGHYTAVMPAANATATDHAPIDWATVSTGADKDNAYMIYNKDQLDLLAHRVNGTHGETRQEDGYENKFFQLAKDIKYTPSDDWNDFDSDESNYEAIGGYYDDDFLYFCGHFDGNSKTISGIRIHKDDSSNTDKYQGIFGVTYGADIHDLTLANARITGHDNTGGIVGFNGSGSTVTDCHVANDVCIHAVMSYARYHGGIAGINNYNGTVENCTSAATLTIPSGNTNCRNYGGIAGENNGGTLTGNLAIGATVPAAANNSYGAITGHNNGGSLLRNYYAACKVANTENATDVGCNNADVTANNGAVSIHTLTLADGITTSTTVTVTIGTTGYYAQGTAIALSYSGTPDGYSFNGYTVSGGTLEGSTLTMPDQDVTVSPALRSTGELVRVSYVDAGGTAQTAQAIALDGHEADLGTDGNETWYFVGTDIAFDHTLNLSGDVNLILADGKTMSVSGGNKGINADDGSLTIYGQTLGTGTLNATATATNGIGIYTDGIVTINGGTVNATGTSDVGIRGIDGVTINGGTVTTTGIMADGDVTISGGKFTATDDPGISSNSGNVILGWTSADDFIKADSYYAHGTGKSVTIAPGYAFHNGSEVISGTISESDYATKLEGMTLAPAVVLADAADNTTAIATAATACTGGKTLAVQLQGRTLYKDGDWNTLCLPFAMTAEQVTAQLAQAKLMTLSSSVFAGQELTLNFEDATTIEPGKPYIIKWTRPDGYTVDGGFDITNPVFTGVTIPSGYTSSEAITAALATASCSTDYVTFIGTYGPTAIYTDPATNLYLGSGNTLYWPSSAKDINSFRAYFHLNNGLTASTPAGARAFVLNFGDEETTGVVPIDNGQLTIDNSAAAAWYDMQGRKLLAQPTARGIYIHGGKKVVIK